MIHNPDAFEFVAAGAVDLGNGSFTHNGYKATLLDDGLEWGEGLIQPNGREPKEIGRLVVLAVDSIGEIDADELGFSMCTDGRLSEALGDGSEVPVRWQLLGGSMITSWHMAETLDERFYPKPKASIRERAFYLGEKLTEAGIHLCTHDMCAGKEKYGLIRENVVAFGTHSEESVRSGFRSRREQLLGSRYERHVDEAVVLTTRDRVNDSMTYGYNANLVELFDEVVEHFTPNRRASYRLNFDDARGVHGHAELFILHLSEEVGARALDEKQLANKAKGDEAFAISDGAIQTLASRLGGDDDEAVEIALHAGHQITDAGHGTLAKDLRTWSVEPVAA